MSRVTYTEGDWAEPSSQRTLSYRLWQPESPQACLILIHGFAEHSGRYEPVGRQLAEQGIVVAAPDLWGHGRSAGRRGDLGDLAACVHTVDALTRDVVLPRVGLRRYVAFGHSFGGLVAILWALARPPALTRLIVQSPLLGFGFRVPPWKAMAATMLATCWPAFRFPMGLDASALSHDPAVVQAYRTDPLVHQSITARTYRSLVTSMQHARQGASALRVPVLLLYGAEDRVVSLPAVQQWFDRLPGEKSCVVFPGCFHELHHEPVQEVIVERVRAWTLE